jgi:hypothetical protein
MQTTRKIGIEMEGYIDRYPSNVSISGVRIGEDGSLSNSEWDYDDEPYGVELTTKPMRDLSVLHQTWRDMEKYGWSTDERAGTHIHVDISDFSSYEMVKLLRFAKGIERIIFMFVQSYRSDNDYCLPVHNAWRRMLSPKGKYKDVDWSSLSTKEAVSDYLYDHYRTKSRGGRYSSGAPWNGKYQWLNVLGSNYTTAEFRLFHAVEDVEELIKQAQLAEGIINFVKNTELKHMEYVIKQLYAQTSVKDLTAIFFSVLGLDFELPTVGQEAFLYLEEKLNKNIEDETSNKLASLMQAQ